MCCDYALNVALPRVDAETLEELEELTNSEYGVNIFHLSMAGKHMLKDNQMLDAMEKVHLKFKLSSLETFRKHLKDRILYLKTIDTYLHLFVALGCGAYIHLAVHSNDYS